VTQYLARRLAGTKAADLRPARELLVGLVELDTNAIDVDFDVELEQHWAELIG
jgi:hypothetical protein